MMMILFLFLDSYPTFFKIFPFCAGIDTFEESKSIYRIRVKPNDNNQILFPDLSNHREINDTDDNLRPLLCIHHLTCSNRFTRMDSKIVKLAFQVLEKNAKEQHDAEEREKFNKRLMRMESTLDTIADRLKEILKK